MNVTGTWRGAYSYGDGYGEGSGAQVPFSLSLTEADGSARQPRFVGYVRDDAQLGGQPERGRVAGVRRQRVIEFRKTMPVCYVSSPDGQHRPLREHLVAQGFTDLPTELPPHCIDYRGELADDGESMRGTWRIVPSTLHTGQGWVQFGSGEGTWTAQRRSPLPSPV